MRTPMFFEQERNKDYITEHFRQGFKVLEVDTSKVTYQGYPWATLNDYGKKKFENLLVIGNSQDRVKIEYV